MSQAQIRIFKTTSPVGWAWTFDRSDTPDAGIDNFATAANAPAALDAIKPLVAAMPGVLSTITIIASAFE